MVESTSKRKIKDSVFTDLFQDKKYLLQLYKALHPEDSDVTEDELADITIKHVLIDGDYNDLGFSVGNRLMVLVTRFCFLGGKDRETTKELTEILGKETIDLFTNSDTKGSSPSSSTNYQKTGRDMPYLFVKSSVALNFT